MRIPPCRGAVTFAVAFIFAMGHGDVEAEGGCKCVQSDKHVTLKLGGAYPQRQP
jgi:hypothetical protein